MDSFPFEVLVRIFQFLQLDSKYRVTRVNRLWHEAGTHVIKQQKRLVVYPDDAPDPGNANGLPVKRLLHVFQNRSSDRLFAGYKQVNLTIAIQHRFDDIEYEHDGSTLLTKHQAASLIRQMAETLEQVISCRCDILNRIQFPALRVMDCRFSLTEDLLSHYVLLNCPLLRELRVGSLDLKGLQSLPKDLTILRVESFEDCEEQKDEPLEIISKLSNLSELSFTADGVRIGDNFFAHMHELRVVELTLFIEEEDGDEDDEEDQAEREPEFGDSGVQLLLKNNENLKEVSLSGLKLTDKSLTYFTDYCKHHGLEKLTLKSVAELEESAVMSLANSGPKSLVQVSILSDDPEEDLIVKIEHKEDSPVVHVTRGADARTCGR